MAKRALALILTLLTLLPVIAVAGSFVLMPENAFELSDSLRENALIEALSNSEPTRSEESDTLSEGVRYVVQFREDISLAEIEKALKDTDHSLLAESESRLFVISLENKDFLEENSGIIDYYEPDLQRNTLATVNDPNVIPSYEPLDVYEAWDISAGSSDVIVAVLDTGVDRSHEDLAGVNILSGYDAVSRRSGVHSDSAGHGTGVIGLIAAAANNGLGIAGIAHGVTILPVKVSATSTTIYSSDLIRGIRFAADAGAKIINMSIGGYSSSYAEQAAVDYAVSKGCILIAAAGNGGSSNYADQKSYPASYEGVISVGSVNTDGERSSFSQYNDMVDIAACGENIPMPIVENGISSYRTDSGTSYSCAFVSGIAALAASKIDEGARFNSEEFSALLIETCGSGRNDSIGHGVINAQRILNIVNTPIITGVYNNGNYSESLTVGFNRGTALLDGEEIADGETIIANGRHTLTVTDGENEKTFSFRLNYDPLSYDFYEFVNFCYFKFDRGTALLDGFPYKSEERITASGRHTFVLTDGDERVEREINLRYTFPTVYGIEDGGNYDRPVEIRITGDGTALLDGERIYSSVTVFENGTHTLTLKSGNGVSTKEISFEINYSGAVYYNGDYKDATAALDEDNGYTVLYGDSLVGVRIYDLSSPAEYLHFLPVGRVYGHMFTETELILFGDSGLTFIERANALSGEEAVNSVITPEGINYITDADGYIIGFGDGNMHLFDFDAETFGWYTGLGFDCEKAYLHSGLFYLLAPSQDSLVRILDPSTFMMTEYDLGGDISNSHIYFSEGYLAADNRIFDISTGEKLLEFCDTKAVKIKDNTLFAEKHIIDIPTGKELGSFPFEISDMVFADNANYIYGCDGKYAVVSAEAEGLNAYSAAERQDGMFSSGTEMNVYHSDAFYDKYSVPVSAAASESVVYALFRGRNSVYRFDTSSLTETEPIPLRFTPVKLTVSEGYITVCFEDSDIIYLAPENDGANGVYIAFPDICTDAVTANGNVFTVSGGRLYSCLTDGTAITDRQLNASAVALCGDSIIILNGTTLSVCNSELTLVRSAEVESGSLLAGNEIAVGRHIYSIHTLERIASLSASPFAYRGNTAVNKDGVYDLTENTHTGHTAIISTAAAVICGNNSVVTLGRGEISVCSFGNASEIISTPEISGIEEGIVYTESTVITYSDGIGYLDGEEFPSGGTATGVGRHIFILALPCGRSLTVSFQIGAKLEKIEFLSGNKTISINESVTLRIRYLPDGASSVPVTFKCDTDGLDISAGGEVTALSVGSHTVTAEAKNEQGEVLTASCVITVRDDLIAFAPESSYVIDRDSGFLKGVPAGTGVSELLAQLIAGTDSVILNNDGDKKSGYVGTGDSIVLYDSTGAVSEELRIIVYGDTDGDGVLSTSDLFELRRILRGYSYDPIYVAAADVNRNGILADNDYRELENILLGSTGVSIGNIGTSYFGSCNVQTPSVVSKDDIIDVTLVITGSKYVRGAFGSIQYSGLEFVSAESHSWEVKCRNGEGTLNFYSFNKDGEISGTTYKKLICLRFRVTAGIGQKISIDHGNIYVALEYGCKTMRFNDFLRDVSPKIYGDFDISFINAADFEFKRDIHEYSVTIPHHNTIADISVTCQEDESVTVSSLVIPDSGEGEVVISHTDASGSTNYYNIAVRRENAPEIDSNCKLETLEVEGFRLSPRFDPDYYEYKITVPYDTEKINIYAVAQNSTAEIFIGDTTLNGESKTFEITVGALNGDSLVYKLTAEVMPKPEESVAEEPMSVPEPVDNDASFPIWAVIVIVLAIGGIASAIAVYIRHINKQDK